MEANFRLMLDDLYKNQHIHPLDFNCRYVDFCRQYSNKEMTETKMSMVGNLYGKKYPRIAILSLDPPNDEEGTFKSPGHRTTEYVSSFHENEDYLLKRPNVHWAMTQIIVKDLLSLFGYSGQAGSAVVHESYSGRIIENVSAFFTHINVAKCCMNNEGKGQAAWQVHKRCGSAYLLKELVVLRPEILVSQGKDANEIAAELFGFPGIEDFLPASRMIQISEQQTLWLPMDHPARHTAEIRRHWDFYIQAVENWKKDQQIHSNYGLYKCQVCGKMVLGFEMANHVKDIHSGKDVEWMKLK